MKKRGRERREGEKKKYLQHSAAASGSKANIKSVEDVNMRNSECGRRREREREREGDEEGEGRWETY